MSYTYIGSIGGLGSLVIKKRQRPKGGSKNVYHLGMNPDFYQKNSEEINRTLAGFGAIVYARPNNFLFTKRPAAEKAWAWFVLRFS